MGGKKNQSEDMNAFEAAMASLHPKADQLDRRWSEHLADEAGRLCVNPAGHQYACVHCGAAVPRVRGGRRWTWPAVAATMTAAAAVLLMMLVVRPGPHIASNEGGPGIAMPSTSVVEKQANPALLESERMADSRMGIGYWPLSSIMPGSEKTSYLNLREQTLRYGVESWESPVLASAASTNTVESPLNSRQLLDSMLKQQGLSGS